MADYVLGIDFGTLSGRALLVSAENGKEIASYSMDYPHAVMDDVLLASGKKLPAQYALQDADDYLTVLKTVIKEVLKLGDVSPEQVKGIGIDFTSCTILPIKKDGTPLSRLNEFKNQPHAYVKLWKHHAAQKYADKMTELAKARKEQFLNYCGGTISSEMAIPKIWQVLEEAPEIYNEADYFIEAGDWITLNLTGKLTRGYTFAVFKSNYIDDALYPSEDFLYECNTNLKTIFSNKLGGNIVRIGEPCGKISKTAAKEFGLSENTVISAPIIDAHVAASGVGIRESGDMFGVIGTSACFMAISDNKTKVSGICGYAKDGILPGFYGYEAGLCCMGDHFAYVANNLTSPAYVKEAQERKISMIELLMEKASKLKAGECGLMALNWWNGNRNILMDSELTGVFVGMNLNTKPEDYMRALMEATAFGTKNIIDNYLKHGIKINKFIATGGISKKNACLMQIFADVLNMKISVSASSQAPALGAAINGAVASGLYPDFNSAVKVMSSKFDAVYKPIKENTAVYNKLYKEYIKLHDYFGKNERSVMKNLIKIAEEQK